MVRIERDGEAVCWTFSLEAGESPPDFYPATVPCIADLRCDVRWDVESGLSVSWKVSPDEDTRAVLKDRASQMDPSAFSQEAKDLAEDFRTMSGEERIARMGELRDAMPQAVMDQAADLVGDLLGGPLPSDASAAVSAIVDYHEERGWSVSHEQAGMPGSVRTALTLGEDARDRKARYHATGSART